MRSEARLVVSIGVAFAALFTAPTARAQGIEQVCLSLSGGKLIDTRDTSTTFSLMDNEFTHVCSSEQQMDSRMRASSTSFQAKFYQFGLRGSSAQQNQSASLATKETCNLGSKNFRQFVSEQERLSTGSTLAALVVECVALAVKSNIEFLAGRISTQPDDKTFLITIEYRARSQDSYEVVQIFPSSVTCSMGRLSQGTAQMLVIQPDSKVTFECQKEPGANFRDGQIALRAQKSGATRSISFDVVSTSVQQEIEEKLKSAADSNAAVVAQLGQEVAEVRGQRDKVASERDVLQKRLAGVSARSFLVHMAFDGSPHRPLSRNMHLDTQLCPNPDWGSHVPAYMQKVCEAGSTPKWEVLSTGSGKVCGVTQWVLTCLFVPAQ
jgi:hypothetical protein